MQNRNKSSERYSTQETGWEAWQLRRLLLALALFLAVLTGKKLFPQQITEIGEEVLQVLGHSTDFEAVFSDLGHAIESEELLEGLENFCVEVFGDGVMTEINCDKITVLPVTPDIHAGLLSEELELDQTTPQKVNTVVSEYKEDVGAVLCVGSMPECGLPEGYTADKLSFGTLEITAPVLGKLNSGFGYRDHPVSGAYSFHGGADIKADTGDPISAFADGVVEFIGEDDSYGLYLQLDHGKGIKSFYAHCSQVCVQKGQRVMLGDTVAKVGSTGRVTGPHLHLELKCGELRVDPAYYIDFL